MKNFYSVLFAAFTLAAPQLKAEDAPKKAPSYLSVIHVINLSEIKQGNLATKASRDEKVKDFGTMLIHDHQKADHELTALAQKHKISVKTPESDAKQVDLDKGYVALSKLKAKEFDRKFAENMVAGHSEAIGLVETAMKNETNKDLQNYLSNILPDLKKHREHAEGLVKSVSAH
jgi:putative membrane protein